MAEQSLNDLLEFCKENSIDVSCLFEDDRENVNQQIIDKFGSCDEVDRNYDVDYDTAGIPRIITESVVYFPSNNLYVKEFMFKKSGVVTQRRYSEVVPREETVTVYVEKS